MKKVSEHILRKLTKRDKRKLMYDLLQDLGSRWISLENLAKTLDVSVSKVKRCGFQVFDREKQHTLLPNFIEEESFRSLWLNHDHLKNPTELLDLLDRTNRWIKMFDRSGVLDSSAVISRFYAAKSWILYELRELVVNVQVQIQEGKTKLFSITLETGHKYHQLCCNTRNLAYWNKRVEGPEEEYKAPVYKPEENENTEYYLRAVDLLFYLSRRGIVTERGHE